MASVKNCFINELLCYYATYVKNTTVDELKIAISKFYTPEEIIESKSIVWDTCNELEGDSMLSNFKAAGLSKNRLDSPRRSAHSQSVDDISNMFHIFDEHS